jgi:hypothetical protein
MTPDSPRCDARVHVLNTRLGACTAGNSQLKWEGTGQGRPRGKVWLVLGWLVLGWLVLGWHALVHEAVVWGLVHVKTDWLKPRDRALIKMWV